MQNGTVKVSFRHLEPPYENYITIFLLIFEDVLSTLDLITVDPVIHLKFLFYEIFGRMGNKYLAIFPTSHSSDKIAPYFLPRSQNFEQFDQQNVIITFL